MKLLFLDTETTGNEPQKDRLCQVCFKNTDGITDALFKPPVPISVKSMSITHITNKMVADKEPFKGSDVYKELERLLADHILVAHNALFDIAILEAEGLKVPRFICTLKVARALDEDCVIPEYNLQFLRYYLDLEITGINAHDAKGDVLVLEAVFDRLFQKLMKEHGDDDKKVLEKMIDISQKPSLIRVFPFGKYRGQKLDDLVRTDPGYLEWLLRQKEAEVNEGGVINPQTEEWIYSLKKHLGRN